jgi:YfiH family protein
VFATRERRVGDRFAVDVAFTNRTGGVSTGEYASLDHTRDRPGAGDELCRNRMLLAAALDVPDLVMMRQVHGDHVELVSCYLDDPPVCDGLVSATAGLALCVRAADCVPLALADVNVGVIGVAHVGRRGVTAGIVASTVKALRDLGARDIAGWLGPHICAGCYEVPAAMRDAVGSLVPAAYGCTTWGTPSIDLSASVVAQLGALGCTDVTELGICTRESDDLFSYRRQGPASGRLGGTVVLSDLATANRGST